MAVFLNDFKGMEHIANASTTINAPASKVWDALTDPAKISKYMFGATVTSDWKEGSPITWKGEFKGKKFEDKGKVIRAVPQRLLQYTHNNHNVTVELSGDSKRTNLKLSQDGSSSDEERKHSEENWRVMLDGLKKVAEG